MSAPTASDTSSPASSPGSTEDSSTRTIGYHGRPVLKEPEWTWEVPWYLFAGGLGGASSALTAAAVASGNRELADRARLIAAGASLVSPPLLIADLGRPARFLNMLRVFKPTSMMSIGSWTLAAYSGASIGAAGLALLDRMPRIRATADAAAGGLGLLMATYTGALFADSAIPVWHEARHTQPALFAASSLASAGAAATLATSPEAAGPARHAAVVGAAAELTVDRIQRRSLGDLGNVYEEGKAGAFHRAAMAATSVGGALVALGGRRRRWLTTAGSVALLAGSICQRWSAYHAGFQSAADPAAVIVPQRERLDRGEGHRRA